MILKPFATSFLLIQVDKLKLNMDMEEAFKTGFLLIPPQIFLRKTWIKRFCALYNSSNHGIQRMELFESEDTYIKKNPSKIITLTDCVKVIPTPQKNQANVFEVRTTTSSYQFSADTFQDMQDWLVSLQNVAFGKYQPKIQTSTAKDEKQEENTLYSSMDEPEVYSVKAMATEAVIRNNLKGDYKLIIRAASVSIAEENAQGRLGQIILTWPYRHIRRYGCGTENFSFEAGRKCASGEGLFTFSTNDGMLIFQSVDAHVGALKSTQTEGEVPNSPSLNEDKNNFFATKDSLSERKSLVTQPSISRLEPAYSMISGYEKEINLINFQSKQPTVKPVPPLTKPPRKSKINKAVDETFRAVDISNNESKYPNVYEEVYKGEKFDSLNFQSDHSHSIPEYSKINVHKHNSAMLSGDNDLSSSVDKIQIYDKTKKENFVHVSYENCDVQLHSKNAGFASKASDDHVYGKLINVKQSALSKTENVYGSLLPKHSSGAENLTSPIYSNIPSFEQTLVDSDIDEEPKHFMQNDAEYAQILKKYKNLSQ
ncbi:docking protein 3-like [Uloborus diversus]|uniref:docking protein 3-like n=1 Tax=Uloborus diversus TaxID=327109 RepID=UPI00240936BC|nr:docking protein 3-like [Uloborus diversus]